MPAICCTSDPGEAALSFARTDRLEVLDYLKQSIERVRAFAAAQAGRIASELLQAADELAADTARLEAELIASGYLPGSVNKDRSAA